jgi:DNA-binding NtrC family response regulator
VAECFRNGVTDYVEKPSNLNDIMMVIRQAVNGENKVKPSNRRIPSYQNNAGIPQIIGESEAIQ